MQYSHWLFLRGQQGGEPVFAPDREPAGGISLKAPVAALLAEALRQAGHPPSPASEFRPQHALLFYDRQHHLQAVVEVCFGCQRAREYTLGPATPRESSFDLRVAAHAFADAGMPLSPNGNAAADNDRAVTLKPMPRTRRR
jgi:hypothetical protein